MLRPPISLMRAAGVPELPQLRQFRGDALPAALPAAVMDLLNRPLTETTDKDTGRRHD